MKVKNMLNAHQFPYKGEMNFQPSMTVPDQAMSVREILQRYAQGLPTVGARIPIYDEDDDMPDMRTLDLAERQELYQQTAKEYTRIREKFEEKALAGGQGHGAMPQAPIEAPTGATPPIS